MKYLISLTILFFSLNMFAMDSYYDKIVCQEYDRATEQMLNRTVVLEVTGEAKEALDKDGEYYAMSIPYRLSVYNGVVFSSSLSVVGNVLTEDVDFQFTSDDEEVSFHVYLDEMEASELSIKGGKAGDFSCR